MIYLYNRPHTNSVQHETKGPSDDTVGILFNVSLLRNYFVDADDMGLLQFFSHFFYRKIDGNTESF